MYSIDVAKERLDEQDRKILKYVLSREWKIKKVLVLGSGEGRVGVVLALLGFSVVCIDVDDYSHYYESANKLFNFKKPILFHKRDISTLEKEEYKDEFSLVLAQRVLHYVRYKEHAKLVQEILPRYMSKKSALFVSISCIDSAMGIEYIAMKEYVEDRFGLLSPEMQQRFSLTVPVCLYSLKEYKQLMKHTHFKRASIYQTAFGNIKGMFTL